MSTTNTTDWNDPVAGGASKEAAEEALHERGGDVDGAILLLNETSKSPTKPPPPRMDSGPTFIDDVTSVAAFHHKEKRIDNDDAPSVAAFDCEKKGIDDDGDDDNKSVDKSQEKPMYASSLRTSATVTEKASDDIMGKTSSRV
jgi:hypothetical protein